MRATSRSTLGGKCPPWPPFSPSTGGEGTERGAALSRADEGNKFWYSRTAIRENLVPGNCPGHPGLLTYRLLEKREIHCLVQPPVFWCIYHSSLSKSDLHPNSVRIKGHMWKRAIAHQATTWLTLRHTTTTMAYSFCNSSVNWKNNLNYEKELKGQIAQSRSGFEMQSKYSYIRLAYLRAARMWVQGYSAKQINLE